MAKKFLISLVLLLSLALHASDLIVISDFDDTIKRTNVDSSGRALYHSIFTQRMFPGMNDLFHTMETYTGGLYILSNSPNALRFNILKLIEKHNLNPLEVKTRKLPKDRDGFKYKYDYVVGKIKNLNTKVILVGDDVGEDPEVYAKVKENYPANVAAVYIHIVKKREIPSSVTPYLTIMDIAIAEYQANRMNFNQAYLLAQNIVDKYSMAELFPKFVFCPKDDSFWSTNRPQEFGEVMTETIDNITLFCKGKR
jgi:phosphatidate phosphatase APP1